MCLRMGGVKMRDREGGDGQETKFRSLVVTGGGHDQKSVVGLKVVYKPGSNSAGGLRGGEEGGKPKAPKRLVQRKEIPEFTISKQGG